jgi:hypothetical protein
MSRPECAEVRNLLPELALGTLTGEDRAGALGHLASCLDCRRELRALSEVADELLLLSPSAEPPVGFESRVMERVGIDKPSRRSRLPWVRAVKPSHSSRRRWVVAAAALLVAALGGGAAVYVADAGDRELAANYRRTLSVADGEYFAARPLVDEQGAAAGHVFGYQGSTSWVFCVVRTDREGVYDIEVTAGGNTWTAGEMSVHDARGSWGQPLDVDLHDVRRITFVHRSTGEALVARW